MESKVSEIVYRAMVDTIMFRPKIIFKCTDHNRNNLIYDPAYLDIARTDGVIFIQITLNEAVRLN